MCARELVHDERNEAEPLKPAERLCSEIQLFDLCDLETCSFKTGKFCGNSDLLEKFERISEKDEADMVRFPQDPESDDDEDGDLELYYDEDEADQDE